ncbi:hypothetical protein HPP92_005124 [Vanilla planifolia]|uniref:Cystic fibrosis transmembrane conductance regulator n=1 Tax=Vanilla planifolia TaxID=51239 RepID=A0A835RTG2_VANPL|nr:hypothetical protein HPP92_005441 [Vanilla planifolia]KAG0494130.1 hypothetical protein HPP92_005124 [Vanilla planifolia]
MAGIFSRLSGGRSIHQTTQTTTDAIEVPPEHAEAADPMAIAAHCGMEVDMTFRPIEHPIEPINHDQPVRCPLPEPSILNDGRIWKERMSSSSARMRADLPVMKDGVPIEREGNGRRHKSAPRSRPILPSLSAPENQILKLLEECNVAEDGTTGI